MSVATFAILNFVLAAIVLAAILKLHTWAIRTARRDHVLVVQPVLAMVVETPEELTADDFELAPALA